MIAMVIVVSLRERKREIECEGEREKVEEREREWLRDKREVEEVVWALPMSWLESMAATPHGCGFGKLMRGEINPLLSSAMTGPRIRSFFFFGEKNKGKIPLVLFIKWVKSP